MQEQNYFETFPDELLLHLAKYAPKSYRLLNNKLNAVVSNDKLLKLSFGFELKLYLKQHPLYQEKKPHRFQGLFRYDEFNTKDYFNETKIIVTKRPVIYPSDSCHSRFKVNNFPYGGEYRYAIISIYKDNATLKLYKNNKFKKVKETISMQSMDDFKKYFNKIESTSFSQTLWTWYKGFIHTNFSLTEKSMFLTLYGLFFFFVGPLTFDTVNFQKNHPVFYGLAVLPLALLTVASWVAGSAMAVLFFVTPLVTAIVEAIPRLLVSLVVLPTIAVTTIVEKISNAIKNRFRSKTKEETKPLIISDQKNYGSSESSTKRSENDLDNVITTYASPIKNAKKSTKYVEYKFDINPDEEFSYNSVM